MSECALLGCHVPVKGRRRYCSRAHQQQAYRLRKGWVRSDVRARARTEAQRLSDSLEGEALRALGFDLDLIVSGLQ